jgi:hypothetical protein
MPLHPDCLGFFDTDGTVESYLESQGTGPYFTFDKEYAALKNRMLDFLRDEKRKEWSQDNRTWPGIEPQPAARLLADWLDIDAALAALCGETKINKTMSPADLARLHIRALEARLDSL